MLRTCLEVVVDILHSQGNQFRLFATADEIGTSLTLAPADIHRYSVRGIATSNFFSCSERTGNGFVPDGPHMQLKLL